MAQTTVPSNSTFAHSTGDGALLDARARWHPDLDPEEGSALIGAMEGADAQTPRGLLAQIELLCWALDVDTDPEPELSQRLASRVRASLQQLAGRA